LVGLDALAGARRALGTRRVVADLCDAVRAGGWRGGGRREVATLVGIAAASLKPVIDPSLVVVRGAVPCGQPVVKQVQRGGPHPSDARRSSPGPRREAALWGNLLTATAHAREQLRPGRTGTRL
jgi:hypothetical protein